MRKQFKAKTRQQRKDRRDERRRLSAEAQSRWDAPAEQPRINVRKLFNPSRVRPKSENQGLFLDSIDANTVTFGLGPAGSGKTYLAVAKAVEALRDEEVRRFVVIRPHLGLGRTMGFQPGDLLAKMSHYMRPVFDALGEFHAAAEIERMLREGTIEVAALEFVRGRTLKDAFVLLDEAQNATFDEMKAFLTRLGEGSRYVITGDLSKDGRGRLEQSDLHRDEQGALEHYADRFGDLPGVAVVPMTIADVVRHPLVKLMLERGF